MLNIILFFTPRILKMMPNSFMCRQWCVCPCQSDCDVLQLSESSSWPFTPRWSTHHYIPFNSRDATRCTSSAIHPTWDPTSYLLGNSVLTPPNIICFWRPGCVISAFVFRFRKYFPCQQRPSPGKWLVGSEEGGLAWWVKKEELSDNLGKHKRVIRGSNLQ